MWSKPFWYSGSLARPGRPVGDPGEYGYYRQLQGLKGGGSGGSDGSTTAGRGQGGQGCYTPGQIGGTSMRYAFVIGCARTILTSIL